MPKVTPLPQMSHFAMCLHLLFEPGGPAVAVRGRFHTIVITKGAAAYDGTGEADGIGALRGRGQGGRRSSACPGTPPGGRPPAGRWRPPPVPARMEMLALQATQAGGLERYLQGEWLLPPDPPQPGQGGQRHLIGVVFAAVGGRCPAVAVVLALSAPGWRPSPAAPSGR